MLPSPISEGDPIGGISRLAKMRKPQCTGVHEDFRIKRNAEITLLRHPLIAAPPLPGHRLKAGEEPPGGDSRPFTAAFIQVHGHIRDTCPARGDDKSLVFRNICEQARG